MLLSVAGFHVSLCALLLLLCGISLVVFLFLAVSLCAVLCFDLLRGGMLCGVVCCEAHSCSLGTFRGAWGQEGRGVTRGGW